MLSSAPFKLVLLCFAIVQPKMQELCPNNFTHGVIEMW